MNPPVNLFALSALLASDPETTQLNHRHLLALAHLCASNGPVSVVALADAIRLSPSQTSRMIVRLEDAGLITRVVPRTNPAMLTPTRAGRRLDTRVKGHVDASLAA